jgi:hypothetical protein
MGTPKRVGDVPGRDTFFEANGAGVAHSALFAARRHGILTFDLLLADFPHHIEPRVIPVGISDAQRRAFIAVAIRQQVENAATMAVVSIGLMTHVTFANLEVAADPPGAGVVL